MCSCRADGVKLSPHHNEDLMLVGQKQVGSILYNLMHLLHCLCARVSSHVLTGAVKSYMHSQLSCITSNHSAMHCLALAQPHTDRHDLKLSPFPGSSHRYPAASQKWWQWAFTLGLCICTDVTVKLCMLCACWKAHA